MVKDCNLWVPINGRVLHRSLGFEGFRVSVVAFQHKSAHLLPLPVKQHLTSLGFRSRLLQAHHQERTWLGAVGAASLSVPLRTKSKGDR